MTKIAIAPNASGTGTFTIAAPNSNTDRTFSLPDATGEVLTSAGTTNFPAGSVIQVVQNATSVGTVSTTSTSFVDITNATATITPRSTSSQILVLWTSYGNNTLVTAFNAEYFHQLVQGASILTEVQLSAQSGAGGLQAKGTMAFSVLISPVTASPVTYKVQHRTNNASSAGTANGGFLTLLEIAR